MLSTYGLWAGRTSSRGFLGEGKSAGWVPVSSPLFTPKQLVERERKGCVGNTTRDTASLRALT